MKKITFILFFICSFIHGQVLNENFSNATCGGNNAFDSCVPNWIGTDGSPSINNFPNNPHAWMWSSGGNGEAIATNYCFIQGETYNISFSIRTDDQNTGNAIIANNSTVNLVATNFPGNVTANPYGEFIFHEPMSNFLNNWQNVDVTFTPNNNFSKLWIFPFMALSANLAGGQSEMAIDNIVITPNEEFTASFSYGITEDNIITATPLNYSNNTSITHEWRLYTRPQLNFGDFDLVTTQTATNFSWGNTQGNTYYFLLHTVMNDCDQVCYIESIFKSGLDSVEEDCEICGPIDCSFINDPNGKCESLQAPTNLQVIENIFAWDPVPGAIQYIINSPSGNEPQIECDCKLPVSISSPIIVEAPANTALIPNELLDQCFIWQVTAVCSDGSTAMSTQRCYPDGRKNLRSKEEVKIYPNPSENYTSFSILTEDNAIVSITINDLYGNEQKTFTENVTANKEKIISWKGVSQLRTGVYPVKITINEKVIFKKLIVE